MLQPRESDIPVLFIFLVVLPVVTYILLGKWGEASKRKERINLLAQIATEEAQRAEMAAVDVIPVASSLQGPTHDYVRSSLENVIHEHFVPSLEIPNHQCALCFRPATTRCSRCKSVRYCSGKCQIIHWRHGHKQECQQVEISSSSSSSKPVPIEEIVLQSVLTPNVMNFQSSSQMKQPVLHKDGLENRIYHPIPGTSTTSTVGKSAGCKSSRESLRRQNCARSDSLEEAFFACSSSANTIPSKDSYTRHKLRNGYSKLSEGNFMVQDINVSTATNANDLHSSFRRSAHRSNRQLQSQHGSTSEFISNSSSKLTEGDFRGHDDLHSTSRNSVHGSGKFKSQHGSTFEFIDFHCTGTSYGAGTQLHCSSDMESDKRSVKSKSASHPSEAKISKSASKNIKTSKKQLCSETEGIEQMTELNAIRNSKPIHSEGSNGSIGMAVMKMMGLKKSKLSRHDAFEASSVKHAKIKMLFPYEEFVKIFHYEFCDLSPIGLVNSGNSCYANAVLQCLRFTKPLAIYLLQRSHSRACCARNWCLMCELEQHLMTSKQNRGPMSPIRILSHMQSTNLQISDGSQEDAHEFLRFLLTSMQCICLEGLGGERVVDPRLQETTFIQHTFRGRLRSKVMCLRCRQESERYENIMDLTLEILGQVESLEDALTQFTTPENLDGENKYRCGRCAAYVRACKQLAVHEAPNILTIVLKRFQEGRYGKINKCITFPESLDMIPFMTGTDDIPPFYILYAVVVHLDTLNASFSGHYVAYVKDLQGNWFRIDDAEVQPVSKGQVMSEGAYILFYMRSSPRPPRALNGKPYKKPAVDSSWQQHCNSHTQKAGERSKQCRSNGHSAMEASGGDGVLRSSNWNAMPMAASYEEGKSMEFSDAGSTDWSVFTSSDDASFTTESNRDSFSTMDHGDLHSPAACRMFSSGGGRMRIVAEENGYVNCYGTSEHY